MVRKYRENDIPLDNIIQDWQYWGDQGHFSSMYFDAERFSDPKENIEKLHANNINIMASIWPALGPDSKIAKEMEAVGGLLDQGHWSGAKVYDPYHPEAREIYWKHLKNGLFDNGMDGYWMDGTEPEFFSSWSQDITTEAFLKAETIGHWSCGQILKHVRSGNQSKPVSKTP